MAEDSIEGFIFGLSQNPSRAPGGTLKVEIYSEADYKRALLLHMDGARIRIVRADHDGEESTQASEPQAERAGMPPG